MTPVRLEPATLRSRVKHSTTEPLRSHKVLYEYKNVSRLQKVSRANMSFFFLIGYFLNKDVTYMNKIEPRHVISNNVVF